MLAEMFLKRHAGALFKIKYANLKAVHCCSVCFTQGGVNPAGNKVSAFKGREGGNTIAWIAPVFGPGSFELT